MLLFDFPGGNVTTSGIDTSPGNASLKVLANSLAVNGPIKTGTGSLTLDASSIVVNGPITAQNAPISITSQSLQVNDAVSAGTGPFTLSSTAATLSAPVTAGSLTISSGDQVSINGPAITVFGSVSTAGQLTVAGGAQLQIGGSLSGSGSISIGSASGSASQAASTVSAQSFSLPSVTIGPSGALDLIENAIATASSTRSLSIAPGGRLDLANNLLDIGYSSGLDPIQIIHGYLTSGYANGTWNGWGIISSAAAGNPAAYGIGYADGNTFSRNADSIELRFTLNGDANLDGTVNLADLTALARNFGKQGQWDTGDFNYDGSTDLSDFLILSREYGQSLASYPAPADANFLNDRLIARRACIRPLPTNHPPQ